MVIFKHILINILIFATLNVAGQSTAKLIYSSDTLDIYVDSIHINNEAKEIKMRFISYFDDSIRVFVRGKCVFSKYVKPDSNLSSTEVDTSISDILIPLNKNCTKLIISMINEQLRVETKIIPKYNYLYLYKRNRKLTIYYSNNELTLH